MRVSEKMLFDTSVQNLNKAVERVLRAQEEVSTGRKVQRPSDDPVGAGLILDFRTSIATWSSTRGTSPGDGRHWAGRSGPLRSDRPPGAGKGAGRRAGFGNGHGGDAGRRPSRCGRSWPRSSPWGIRASTTSTSSPGSPRARPRSRRKLRDVQRDRGHDRRRHRSQRDACDEPHREPGVSGGGRRLRLDERPGHAGRPRDGDGDERRRDDPDDRRDAGQRPDQVSAATADLGACWNRLDEANFRHVQVKTQLRSLLSDREDVDMIKAASELTIGQQTLEAARASTARILQSSLLDFLR